MTPYEKKAQIMDQMEARKNASPYMIEEIKRFAEERDFKRETAMVQQALQQAITETVQRLASVIINERRAEIEAACNFGELRDVLAAELARQFMASRMLNQPTPFDPRTVGGSGVTSGPMQSTNKQSQVGQGSMLQKAQPAIAHALGKMGTP